MQIKNRIIQARQFEFGQHILKIGLALGILLSLSFLVMIELETIFYFFPTTKLWVIICAFLCLVGFLLFGWIYYGVAASGKVARFKNETIARKLGEAIYPEKKDTIINALQLESQVADNESQDLASSFTNRIGTEIDKIQFHSIFSTLKLDRIKIGLLGTWIFMLLIFSLNYQSSANAFYRWIHYHQEFPVPKPFKLTSVSKNLHILGGEKTAIQIKAIDAAPDTVNLILTPNQVYTQSRDSLTLTFSTTKDSTGIFQFELPELFQDYTYTAEVHANHFWEAWEKVSSNPDTIFVTDRPNFESFDITVIPPDYSKMSSTSQKGNVAVVDGLKGSVVHIELTSNRVLDEAFLSLDKEKISLKTNHRSASGHFTLKEEGEFTVNLVDIRGITNRDPVPYSLELISDQYPSLMVLKPSPLTELGSDQSIQIHLEIEDDYGFSNLQVAYEVRRPLYLQADPYVAMFPIHDLIPDTTHQTVITLWDLSDMFLMPEDEVHFHFELTDNDHISGPKRSISSTFIARVPSLADLYETAENTENEFMENMMTEMDEFTALKEEFEQLELDALKAKELNWEQQQEVKQAVEKAKQELANLEKMAEAIESITEQAEKHDLFTPDLLDKFKELSELIQDVIPDDMLQNMDDLQEALENMDMKQLQDAMENLADNMDQIEQDLDRYLDIFKRLQAEQKMDELQTRMAQLIKQQQTLDQDISQTNEKTDQSTLARLEQEEKRNLDEFENIKSVMEEASDMVEPYSQQTAKNLSDMAESELAEITQQQLSETMEMLNQGQPQQAQQSSQESLGGMEQMMSQLMQMQQQFQQETVSEMVEKFQALMQDLLYMSSQEEQLHQEVKSSSRNSPRLRDLAMRQQVLQDQLQSITNQMMALSKETFAITPDIGRGIGKANAGMEEAKEQLAERNVSQASQRQSSAMEGLNEAALGLFNSMQSMQSSGSAAGMESFMQMMQQMAGQQQGVNQQGTQLSMGQMAASAQQQLMQQMLQQQQGIRKSLEQLMNEMRHSGQKGLGNLSGVKKDMDEVIKDLQRRRFTRKTQERQQRILSRMLDSQTSMTQRGFKDERKSTSGDGQVVFEGPGGLPTDLGQRQSLALQALNKAIKAGYSRENQTMIKRYFNAMTQLEVQQEVESQDEE